MKGNPFEAPVKPPKARPRSTNPFEEDEVTIEFRKPAVAGQTQSPIFRSTNSRRYSPLDRTRISSTSTTPKSDSGISNPRSSTKRVIGGGSPHESLLSKARGQLFNSTRLAITSTGSDYARLDTSSESGSPFTHTGITDEESQIILSPMSGDTTTTSVGLHRYHNKTTNNSRLGREVGLNTSQRNNNTVTTALTSTTIYDDNIGVELIETGIQYPTEGRSITPPRKPPKQSRELVLLRDSTGTSIEQQSQDSEDEDTGIADIDNVNSENNSDNDSDNNSDKDDDNNNNTKNSQRSKKQKDRNKERKQKMKVPKTGVVCVDYTDENAVIRHLLSERGKYCVYITVLVLYCIDMYVCLGMYVLVHVDMLYTTVYVSLSTVCMF